MFNNTNRHDVAAMASRGIAEIGIAALRPRTFRRSVDARVSRYAIERLERVIVEALTPTTPVPAFGNEPAGVTQVQA